MSSFMIAIYWLIAFVILIGIEMATMALTTIWFAGGALVACILALAGANVEVQLTAFVVVSFLLLFFTRPVVMRFVNRKTTKTNAESLVGKKARITAEVNNIQGTGTAMVGGQEWTAVSADESRTFPVGAIVVIREIRGVKLIVSEIQEET